MHPASFVLVLFFCILGFVINPLFLLGIIPSLFLIPNKKTRPTYIGIDYAKDSGRPTFTVIQKQKDGKLKMLKNLRYDEALEECHRNQ